MDNTLTRVSSRWVILTAFARGSSKDILLINAASLKQISSFIRTSRYIQIKLSMSASFDWHQRQDKFWSVLHGQNEELSLPLSRDWLVQDPQACVRRWNNNRVWFVIWKAGKIFVEGELADDVAGPVHDINQHAEVVSGPDITSGVQSKTPCFTIRLVERPTKFVMAIVAPPL